MPVPSAVLGELDVPDYSLARVVWDWFMTVEPRRIAARHLALSGWCVVFGILAALLLRFELMTPELDRVGAHTFGTLLTLHGSLMILGMRGASFRANAYPPEFQVLQTVAAAGATILLAGVALSALNLRLARPEHTVKACAL